MEEVKKQKTGERIRRIAEKNGLSYIVVDSIIREYLTDLKESIADGERTVIDGIVTIFPHQEKDAEGFVPRARISPALRKQVERKLGIAELTEDTEVESD